MEFYRGAKKFLRLRLKKASRYPEEVQIEITNVCNLNCLMCPRTALQVPIKHMPLDLYETVLSKLINPHIITLSGWGEPLCHPQFHIFIEKANEIFPLTQIKFTTNGLLLTPEEVETIAKHNIFQINISIDQLEEEKNSNFHRYNATLKDNIRFLIKQRSDKKYPIVRLQTVIQKEGWQTIEGIIDFAAEVGVYGINLVRLDTRWSELQRPTWIEESEIIKRARNQCRQEGLRFECANDQNFIKKLASRFDRYCLLFDNFIYITVEGEVTPCCNLYNYKLGNLREQSIDEIWHNQSFRQLRQKGKVKECESCDILKYHYSSFQAQKQKEMVLLNKLT